MSFKKNFLPSLFIIGLALLTGVAFAASRGWVVFPSPNTGNTNFLSGVSAISDSDAWAVGYEYDASDQQLTVVQHWDGTSWSSVASPNPGTAQQCGDAVYVGNTLSSVDAISNNDVWAVGNICGPGTAQTLTVHWDGSQWAVIPSPNKSALDDSELLAVSALSNNDVWAVGDYKVDFQYQWETLVEHWDGISWSIMPTPNPVGAELNYLTGVAAISPTDVWAVGYTENTGGPIQAPLIEHYDGQRWKIVPSPYPTQSDFNALYGVTAISANDVWAVGYENLNSQGKNGQALIVHWDGTKWALVESPIAGNATLLLGVTASSSTDVTAVGYIQTGNVQFLPVTEHWNGSSWSVVAVPNLGKVAQLYGVSTANRTMWAVGSYSRKRMTQGYMESPLNLTMRR